MKIRINFDKAQVVERGDDFIEIECKRHESPKLPAFVLVYKDGETEEHSGYYLVATEGGTLKASRHETKSNEYRERKARAAGSKG